jgi:hypothetical protein
MKMQAGTFGQGQWLDSHLFTITQDALDDMTYHWTTTLKEFFNLADGVTVCGNFLDVKNINPIPPMWTMPIFNFTIA